MSVRAMTVDITGKCQNRCIFCYNKDKGGMMEFARFKEIVDRFPSLARVDIGGGEPLLNPWLPDMAAYLLSKKLRTDISTNGLIYPESIVRMADRAGELLSLQVNFPAGEEKAYDGITRTSDGFPMLMGNVDRLAASGLRTRLILTLCRENAAQLLPVVQFAKERGLPLIVAPALPVEGNPAQILEAAEIDELYLRVLLLRMGYGRVDFSWSYHGTACPAVAKAYRIGLKEGRCSACTEEKVYVDAAGAMKGCEFLG